VWKSFGQSLGWDFANAIAAASLSASMPTSAAALRSQVPADGTYGVWLWAQQTDGPQKASTNAAVAGRNARGGASSERSIQAE
jgi:hypothetical protein